MSDTIKVNVMFRKAIWRCSCGQEDFTDLTFEEGNTYTHTCSSCGKTLNSFVDYTGNLSYTQAEYDALDASALASAKSSKCSTWFTAFKNPPVPVEPTEDELQAQKAFLEQQLADVTAKLEA